MTKGILMRAVTIICLAAGLLAGSRSPLTAQGPEVSLNAFAMRFNPEPVSDVEALPLILRRPLTLRLEHVTVGLALRAITARTGIDLSYSRAVVPLERVVSVDVEGAPLAEALRQVLRDAPVELWVSTSGKMALVPIRADDAATGSIAGRVTEAKTGQSIAGASVTLAGTRWHATTGEDGRFRLEDVAAGTYTLTVRRIGYTTGSTSVTVAAGQEATVDVRLEVSASPLDAVVVTGTVSAAQVKELPSPITVVTAEDIQRRGIPKLNDLFRGEIPGVFAPDFGAAASSYGAPVYVRGATSFNDVESPVMKTYVDGVEMANSQFLNQLDPTMIDHVEIIRGPEASTLYGAQAINGVMQVFTKKGSVATPPHVTASFGIGSLEGSYGTGTRHEDNVVVTGGTTDLSYNVGATYTHDGAWTPYHSINRYDGYGSLSLRPAGSPLRVDVTGRLGRETGRISGGEATARAIMNGTLQFVGIGLPVDNHFSIPEQTLGVTVHYAARPTWQHTLTAGIDHGTNGNEGFLAPGYSTPSDSFASVFSSQSTRITAAYNSALDVRLSDNVSGNIIVGGDYWHYQRKSCTDYKATTEVCRAAPGSIFNRRRLDHNTGVFSQVRLGVADAVFLTAGVRVDEGPSLPEDRHHRATAPRVGASYVRMVGPVQVKLRAGYGSALRPADPSYKEFIPIAPDYVQLASPNLLAERQTGWDGGVELYAGDHASLSVTRYHQLARDLIYTTFGSIGDTVTTLQYVNVARVRNSGWELEGTLRLLPSLTAKATYSIVESVVDSLAPDDQTGFVVGDALPGVPHHTGALTLIGATRRLSVEGAVSYVGTSVNYDQGHVLQRYFPRLGTPDYGGAYAWKTLPAAYRVGVRVSYDLTPHITIIGRGENLTNRQVYDQGLIPIDQLGRTTLVGLRIR